MDFHVTSDCNQECPYCWGPQGFEQPVGTKAALRIIDRIQQVGARRIVFTGGDPLKRKDIARLLRHARQIGLEVALSTTGDELSLAFLRGSAPAIDLISLPLDGASEEVSSRTKKPGHFTAILRALEWLRGFPAIDVKLCTPVTRHNLQDVRNIARLAEEYAETTQARVFYNIFQTFRRSMDPPDWESLLVTDKEFAALEQRLAPHARIRMNFLSRLTLDRLYAMVFPDGRLVLPKGPDYLSYGPFLEVEDLQAVIRSSPFDAAKHLRHSRGWGRAVVNASGGPACLRKEDS
jgi:MoaA/NifB/PqqE/SkfB family radical SAM enzyme